ncbi:MAG: histone deacetylase [Chthoniobacterales bacterium]
MIIFHDPKCAEYSQAGHPERPSRVTETARILKAEHTDWRWATPEPATTDALLRAHSQAHIEAVRQAENDFDADSPAYPEIYRHAIRATGAAISVARQAMQGSRAFSLMRPPGHHAMRNRAMGFCYFGHVAVAALDALENGVERVAILDFDAHHGNGTEDIVADNARIAFASIHQFPGYPGTGTRSHRNVHNYPVAPGTTRETHVAAVKRALDVLVNFRPDLLLVSAGFDAYIRDPITEMTLERQDFEIFGRWLRDCGIPAGAILEGGYSDDLPGLTDAFLTSWDCKAGRLSS